MTVREESLMKLSRLLLFIPVAALAGTTWTVTQPKWISSVSGKAYSTNAQCVAALESNGPGTYQCTASDPVMIVGVSPVPPPPPPPGTCAQGSGSFTTTGAFDFKVYGNYFVQNDNWGGTPGQKFWSNSSDCWGVTTSATRETDNIGSYPSVTRGWTQNASAMQAQGGNSWTVKSGMGIVVTALAKAQVHWSFSAPASGARWLGLMDIYFHATNSPDPSAFPPVVDLMIDQSIQDQALSGQPHNQSTYYAYSLVQDHGTTVTIGGVQYALYVDDSDETGFHSSGGHTIHLFRRPTAFSDSTTGTSWGTQNGVEDVAAVIAYFMQANPVDDAGNALKFANGNTVTSPLIASNLFLNSINAGWEIDFGTLFTNSGFCVAMQAEPDCP